MEENGNREAGQKNILVVTDVPEDLDLLQCQLGGAGYRLVQTWDVEQALQKVRECAPDLVLLDLMAHGVQGMEFCRKLRSQAETEALPVIVIADSSEGTEETVFDLGADGFICRPFESVELLSRVRNLLRMKELHDKVKDQNRQLLDVNTQMDSLIQQLMARNRELEQGLEMAHRLQEALLPQKYPRVKNISFAHKYNPADAIGGDVFQIIGMEEDRAAIFMCDVSGHGVRAALITSIVKTVIDYIDLTDKTPTDVLVDFNSRFRGVLGPLTPQIYATGVVIMVDGERRTIALACAGHPPPLLISKKRMSAEPAISLEETGPVLGLLSNPDYHTSEKELAVGDILLAYTDGIYEVRNTEGEMFELDRLQRLVADNTHLIPRDLIQKLISETEAFMGSTKRPDDVCLVSVEVH